MSKAWFFRIAGLCLAAAATAGAFAQGAEERLYVLVSPFDTAGPSAVTLFDVQSDGALVQGGTYDVGGRGDADVSPQPMSIDAGGRFLFVANNVSGDVSVLAIGSGGALSPVATSPVPLMDTAFSLATHPVLPRLYVPLYIGGLRVFGVDGAGALDLMQTVDAGFLLRGVVVSRSGGFLYVINGFFGESSVRAYQVGADGTLTEIDGSPFSVADSRLWDLAISPDGSRLYAHDLDLGIFAFDIDPAGGLTPVAGSPFAVGPFTDAFTLTPDGRFLYADSPFNPAGIFGFAAPSNGALPPVPGSPFAGDYIAAALLPSAVSPRLYLVARENARITTFGIDLEGSLTQLGPRTDVVDEAGRAPSAAVALALGIPVAIDIRPGSPVNPVNPGSSGIVPVAILGASGFDVTTVDASSVRFGPSGAPPVQWSRLEDVNDDGEPDLVLHFRTAATGIACGDTSAGLTGTTTDGRTFHGQDSIVTRGCHPGNLALPVPVSRPRTIQVGP